MIKCKRLIVVLGAHRSGTSFLCQILDQYGLNFPDNLLPPNEFDNPLGYFEAREIVQINNLFLKEIEYDWQSTEILDEAIFQGATASNYRKIIRNYFNHIRVNSSFVLKDPRLCRLLPLWQPVLAEFFDEIKYICIIRHPLAVIQSLAKRAQIPALASAAIICPYHNLILWLTYNLELITYSQGTERLLIDYESLVTAPEKCGKPIAQFLMIDQIPVINQFIIDIVQVEQNIQRSKESSGLDHHTLDFYDKLYHLLIHENLKTNDIQILRKHLRGYLFAKREKVTSIDNNLYLTELRRGDHKEFMTKTHGRINRRSLALSDQRSEFDVLFISHDANTRGHIYRVKHICDVLNLNGVRANWIEIADLDELKLFAKRIKCVVIFRCENSQQLEDFISECHTRNIRIIYDIDDFIFDISVLEHDEIHFISALTEIERKQWRERFQSYRQVMTMADVISVPTHTLQAFSQKFCKKSVIFPNSFDPVNKRIANLAVSTKITRHPSKTIIGYASGTATHEYDFRTIKAVLVKLLLLYPDLHINIIGHLRTIQDFEFDPFRERIHLVPVVPHTALAFELVNFDINLIPLERNRFTDSKSELKYFEAALLKIPSVAVANPVYDKIIQHGQNGYLAADEKTWITSLSLLIESSVLRKQIGEAAYNTAVQLYDIEKLAVRYKQDVLGF